MLSVVVAYTYYPTVTYMMKMYLHNKIHYHKVGFLLVCFPPFAIIKSLFLVKMKTLRLVVSYH